MKRCQPGDHGVRARAAGLAGRVVAHDDAIPSFPLGAAHGGRRRRRGGLRGFLGPGQVRAPRFPGLRRPPPPPSAAAVTLVVPAGESGGALSTPRTLTMPAGWTAQVWARVPDARMEAWTPEGDLLVSQPNRGSVMRAAAGRVGHRDR